jgi:hypothetical protein
MCRYVQVCASIRLSKIISSFHKCGSIHFDYLMQVYSWFTPGLSWVSHILEGRDVLNKELKSKKKERSQPIVDAKDVVKLLLELEAHNHRQARPRDRVGDPFRPIIRRQPP